VSHGQSNPESRHVLWKRDLLLSPGWVSVPLVAALIVSLATLFYSARDPGRRSEMGRAALQVLCLAVTGGLLALSITSQRRQLSRLSDTIRAIGVGQVSQDGVHPAGVAADSDPSSCI